ncbi:MAG: NAD(P)H-hydrate dehydratase [Psychrobacter sp.]|nr:NAD(P)H-hydrate dehydratase [Psychrobacter sp.]
MRSTKYLSAAMSSMLPIDLYTSEQVYSIEQAWFAQGYDSFALMQQAAWQMAQHIVHFEAQNAHHLRAILAQSSTLLTRNDRQPTASIWVGHGNNGGDGWLIAYYLQQAGWRVEVITVGIDSLGSNGQYKDLADALRAQKIAIGANVPFQRFEDISSNKAKINTQADVYIDALFGIGLDRAPDGVYKQAIEDFNNATGSHISHGKALVIAVDIPSGLEASTGQVFARLAIKADITLCLIARKFGLHTKDGSDYAGMVIDIPLIPFESLKPAATLLSNARSLAARHNNSYKGSYGHVLIIGGNRIDGSQGMGGAAILASASAMATGAGKITVACHNAFHGAVLSSLPDAMTIDLHDQDGVKGLIKEASVVAIGMGLGRDDQAQALFVSYVQAVIQQGCDLVIDADGLYHLASLQADGHKLVAELKAYSATQQVCLTPHSGEAARLLDKQIVAIENDRLTAIRQCATTYGGSWVLKGTGSLVLEQTLEQLPNKSTQIYVCAVGNAGMATAGMGDVLSGVTAGLLAQQDLTEAMRSLSQAVLIHGLAGDLLINKLTYPISTFSYQDTNTITNNKPLMLIGQRGLQAQDMPAAIRQVIDLVTE